MKSFSEMKIYDNYSANSASSSSTSLIALNGTQKNIIEGTLNFYIEDVVGFESIDIEIAKSGLQAMLSTTISEEQRKRFVAADIWESISAVRTIISHPCPQNRTENYPYFGTPQDPNIIVYKNEAGKAAFEPKGLLGLTSRNDKTAPAVTKEAVVKYITQLVEPEIKKMENEIRRLKERTSLTSSIPSDNMKRFYAKSIFIHHFGENKLNPVYFGPSLAEGYESLEKETTSDTVKRRSNS